MHVISFLYRNNLIEDRRRTTYVVTLCGSSMSMSISSLVASVTELVCEVKRLPLPIGNTLFTLTDSRICSLADALIAPEEVPFSWAKGFGRDEFCGPSPSDYFDVTSPAYLMNREFLTSSELNISRTQER